VLYRGDESNGMCDAFEQCRAVSEYLLDQAPAWLGSD
jgi:hypothetical protein